VGPTSGHVAGEDYFGATASALTPRRLARGISCEAPQCVYGQARR